MQNIYAATGDRPVAEISVNARAAFIAKTYMHLFGAILAFTLLELAAFAIPVGAEGESLAYVVARAMLGTSWLLVLGAFMIVSWIFSGMAHKAKSKPSQYLALCGFVLAEALVFMPLLVLAFEFAEGAITSAAAVTLGGFAALTFVVFWTRKDFSFLGAFLRVVAIGALLLMVTSMFTSFNLGLWFNGAMVAFACGAVLYDTSKVLHHYPEDRYVGAALELFASVALLFWYVLRIFMSRD